MQLCGQTQSVDSIEFIRTDFVKSYQSMTNYMDLYIDSNKAVAAPALFAQQFMPLESFAGSKKIPAKLMSANFYLRFGLHNVGGETKEYSFFAGKLVNKMKLYYSIDGGKNFSSYPVSDHSSGFLNFRIDSGQKIIYVLQLSFFKHWNNNITPSLIDINYIETFKNETL
jgi:hypothetical protein